jgi:hypothetical protein
MRSVFEFVGVDATFEAPQLAREHNPTQGLRANRAGQTAIRLLDRALGSRRAAALRARVPLSVVRPLLHAPSTPAVELDPGVRAELETLFREDAERLRHLTNRRFETWCV